VHDLPFDVDPFMTTASLKNELLEIFMPKVATGVKPDKANAASTGRQESVLFQQTGSRRHANLFLIQELKNSTALPVKPVKVDRDKVSRAHAVVPLCEAGRVYLPRVAPWLADFLDEHSSFDESVYDDSLTPRRRH
jgi:predicted phage terminase large subunit-like protein